MHGATMLFYENYGFKSLVETIRNPLLRECDIFDIFANILRCARIINFEYGGWVKILNSESIWIGEHFTVIFNDFDESFSLNNENIAQKRERQ
jgi:hypothetical protein